MYQRNTAINLAAMGPAGEHEHVWAKKLQHGAFTGEPSRKCTVKGCRWITLDLKDEEDYAPYWEVRGADGKAIGWTWDDRAEADAFARQEHGALVEYEYDDALEGEIVADYRKATT